jgi:hypothetical protein
MVKQAMIQHNIEKMMIFFLLNIRLMSNSDIKTQAKLRADIIQKTISAFSLPAIRKDAITAAIFANR